MDLIAKLWSETFSKLVTENNLEGHRYWGSVIHWGSILGINVLGSFKINVGVVINTENYCKLMNMKNFEMQFANNNLQTKEYILTR